MAQTVFITKTGTEMERMAACLLVRSIRTFGGVMSECPIWLFDSNPLQGSFWLPGELNVHVISLDIPVSMLHYEFGGKVYACAYAEEMAPADVHSLVWIDPSCLVVNPPMGYELSGIIDVAVRPVHIRNVGLRETDVPDSYWKEIFSIVGVGDIDLVVESFVDRQPLRAYFNTHAFAINPAKGLLRRWLAYFKELVGNRDFQVSTCQDNLHRIFLHQAVLSVLLAVTIDPNRLRILTPDYNYPYNLQSLLPPERRVKALNDLTTFTYEDRVINPDQIRDIKVHEPLRSWLAQYG